MLDRDGVYDNIRAWCAGTEKLDVISLTELCRDRFGDHGPMSTLALCLLTLDRAEAEADELRHELLASESDNA